jgi:hypothetical protein
MESARHALDGVFTLLRSIGWWDKVCITGQLAKEPHLLYINELTWTIQPAELTVVVYEHDKNGRRGG